jgi:cytosine/adenosine deaminase-related metal-dependent hydrolase
VSIIHGVALNAHDFKEMADNHVGLIWSPRSNIELYGETTDVRAAKTAGVEIALAPDWSPTGSDGVLEELNYAATWDAGHNPRIFTDAELVKMVTAYPAELAKLNDKIGTLEQHHLADLLIIQSEKTDAYHALVTANPSDVRLVVIGGDPVYGDEDLMRGLQPDGEFQPVQFCKTTKFLNLQSEKLLQSKPPKPWKDTVAVLRKTLQASGLSLAELTPCEDSP